MKLLFLIISSMLSLIFTQMNHPLAMGLILLIQTTFISIITGMLTQSFWFSYVLFLIFLGGMLVLFIYVTSLASNEMFSMSTKLLMLAMIMLPTLFMIYNNFNPSFMNQETFNFMTINNFTTLPLIKLYNNPTSIITIILATYLFLTLIAVVKITNIFVGPLRHLN
uniref:NADH dehydrogenase subunit 6 n=1 Tax=Rhabdoblatta similsinuata TaxID=2609393 RepID=UPI002797F04D|nr:NADH dehydrogenase subunit 6 [Rhabdoblatta similsinuata]WGO57623.1 NADH dehydrogenase subunit 6 [Rhabdoblatta similsinuata]